MPRALPRAQNPVALITKGGAVLRDIALLGELARCAAVHVFVTIPFTDEDERRALEPFAAPIEKRFEVLLRLRDQGVPTGVSLSPIIPGLNDSAIPELLKRAKQAGASQAFMSLLRLPAEVKDVFVERIRATLHPQRVAKIEHAIMEMRGGALYDPRFGTRMRGQGKRWSMVEQLFDLHCRRLGLNQRDVAAASTPPTFRRPTRQLGLFDG